MELCFAGDGDYRGVLDDLPECPGPIYDKSGKRIGEHCGIQNYTVGQRKGLPASTTGPLYVIEIRRDSNALVVGSREDGLTSTVRAHSANILLPQRFRPGEVLQGKIRSTGSPSECRILDANGTAFDVQFAEPVFAPAAGQHLVLYDHDDNVVAGGVISVG
jgi:tRNA-specific 2-thiouridylase